MKKLLILIIALLSIIMTSCDHLYYGEFYIINNCNESIVVSRTSSWNTILTLNINANQTVLFIKGEGIASPKGVIDGWVKFDVTKDAVLSNVNYKDFSRWIYEQTTDKYHSKMYLHINPEDFE